MTRYVIVRQDSRNPLLAAMDPTFVYGPFASAADAEMYVEYLERLDEDNKQVELDRTIHHLDGMVATGQLTPEDRDLVIESGKRQEDRRAADAARSGHRLVAYTVHSLSTPGRVRK